MGIRSETASRKKPLRALACCTAALAILVSLGVSMVLHGNLADGYLYEQCFSTSDLSSTTIWSSSVTSGTCMATSEDVVYAYNADAGYFATNGREGYEALDVPVSGYRTRNIEGAVHDQNWDTGYGAQVLQAMATMQQVDAFWRNEVGIQGIDGKDGLYRLVVLDEKLGGGARCLSAKRDGKIYSYTILLGQAPDGNTIGVYPEILCHEYTHGVLSNLVQFKPGNGEHGALNEAIADIFGIAYLKDPSWHLAASLASYGSDKDIKGENRTMDDYDYEGGYVGLFWPSIVKAYCNIAKKADTNALDVHGNSYIVSHTVYEIWNGPYAQDFSKLTETMSAVLTVLPADATFSDFREDFTAAARLLYGNDTAKEVEGYFDKAGIPDKGSVIINRSKLFVDSANRIDAPTTQAQPSQEAVQPAVPTTRQTGVDDYRGVLSSSDAYYALLDLDGDGSDELLTASSTSDGSKSDSVSVYTMRDGAPTHAIGSLYSMSDYIKYDAINGSLLHTWGGAGSAQWITFYLEAGRARTEYLTQDLDHNSYYREVYDEDFSLLSSESLSQSEFGKALASWDECNARASYVTFSPL